MILVSIESPYAGDVETNERYARACMWDCIQRGEAPIASHLLYTQPGILDDKDPVERRLGMLCGFAWNKMAHKTVLYTDLGITKGMIEGMERADADRRPVEERMLGKAWTEAEERRTTQEGEHKFNCPSIRLVRSSALCTCRPDKKGSEKV